MPVTYAGRAEAKMVVPSPGAAVSATNSGGGPTAVTVPAASYYLTTAGGVSSLLTTLQTQLNSTRAASPGSWTATFSTTTGLVTIDCPSGAVVTKTGGTNFAWDAGVSSTESITGDGYLEVTASETTTFRKIGFATAAIGVNHALIKWGLYLRTSGGIYTTELGVEVDTGSTYVSGDTLTIKRTGTTVTYLKNGTVIATSGVSSSGSLVVGAAALSSSATLCALRLYSAGVRSALTLSASLTAVTVTATTYSVAWTSTTLRDVLGLTADISAVNAPQTGTKQSPAVWFPNSPLNCADHPSMTPPETDLRSSESPTGVQLSLVGNTKYAHTDVHWNNVTVDYIRESSATYANASLEVFFRNCIAGTGSISWFSPGNDLQIYWSNAGTDTLLGADANSGVGVAGWRPSGFSKFSELARPSQQGWVGQFNVKIPRLVSNG